MKWIIGFEHSTEEASLYKWEVDQLKWKGRMSFTEIASQIGEDPVPAFFPSEKVSFFSCLLPQTTDKKIRQALPSLLEEELATPPEDNFFALPKGYQAGQRTTVGVMDVLYVEKLLLACQQSHIHLQSLSPDCFLVPYRQEGLNKSVQPGRIVVRSSQHTGFALPPEHAALLMQELETVKSSELFFSEDLPFNFLQAQFAVKEPKKPIGKMAWIYGGLGALFLVHLLILVIVGAILQSRLDQIKESNLEEYAQVFPGATKMNSPQVMIERELKQLGAGLSDPLQSLLMELSQVLTQAGSVSMNRIDYTPGRLVADFTLPDMSAVEQLNHALSQSGLHSEKTLTEQDRGIAVQLTITNGEKK